MCRQERAKRFETPDHDTVGLTAPLPQHFEIVGKDDEVPGSIVGRGFQGIAHFREAAGTELGWPRFTEAVAKNRQRQDAHSLEYLWPIEIQGVPKVNSTIRMHRVEAAVQSDPTLPESAVGVGVTGKAPSPEGSHLVMSGSGQKIAAVGQQGALFLQGVVGKMLALPIRSRKEQGTDFIGPFRMQVQLDIVIPGTNHVNDDGQVLDSEASGKQWLHEKKPP
ncbi:hypothetical protein E4Q08_17365 [Candidatus Accumulibacter phosphatis]|uniref:Uncharacterized protein n=1 Tax=Candidatus Accumulibacter contiguus TaxID=2954381 RepID=A0ABX1TEU2_9PROT|nr:hypothetical protein [Candidatus Accumulibacter contiguus]NMQ06888.1 hypothetical protein [Candidatus Accumulibacter contiguus]